MIILEVGYIGLSFAQGSVGLVEGSGCPKSFVL